MWIHEKLASRANLPPALPCLLKERIAHGFLPYRVTCPEIIIAVNWCLSWTELILIELNCFLVTSISNLLYIWQNIGGIVGFLNFWIMSWHTVICGLAKAQVRFCINVCRLQWYRKIHFFAPFLIYYFLHICHTSVCCNWQWVFHTALEKFWPTLFCHIAGFLSMNGLFTFMPKHLNQI